MLKERQTEPGLDAFYDIQTGNELGLFFQPWSLHRANPLLRDSGKLFCRSNIRQMRLVHCISTTPGDVIQT